MVRGLFVFAVTLSLLGCDKQKADEAATPVTGADADPADAGAKTGDLSSGDAETSDLTIAQDEPPELEPPWRALAPSWEELRQSVADAELGTVSGEIFGDERPVRAIIRAQCGSGALLQAVYEDDEKLWVTPAMPVRFVGLGTEKPVRYTDGNFDVTVDFEEDGAERLSGQLKIDYEERGVDKTFIDLRVDGEPLTTLLEPRLPQKGAYPEFAACHPSGRFYARLKDGTEETGYMNATIAKNGRALVATVLLHEQSGLRIVTRRQNPDAESGGFDLSDPARDADILVVVEAFHTPELTRPSEAMGANLGREQKVKAHQGEVTVGWPKKRTRPTVDIHFDDLRIPVLLDGPLRGTTFDELRIEATAFEPGEYPTSPPAEPLAPTRGPTKGEANADGSE